MCAATSSSGSARRATMARPTVHFPPASYSLLAPLIFQVSPGEANDTGGVCERGPREAVTPPKSPGVLVKAAVPGHGLVRAQGWGQGRG